MSRRLIPAARSSLSGGAMRFIHLYLIGYFVLIIGAGMALYQSGVLARMDAMWVVISLVIAAGLGIMLAVIVGKPTVTRE
jgi:hypothetical protein